MLGLMRRLMLKDNVVSTFDSSKFQDTSHSFGKKFMFFTSDWIFKSSITQIALGKLNAGENVESHLHESMEEVFFILNGEGFFIIGDEHLFVSNNCCVRIPCGLNHSINALTDMHFYYFGVAKTDEL